MYRGRRDDLRWGKEADIHMLAFCSAMCLIALLDEMEQHKESTSLISYRVLFNNLIHTRILIQSAILYLCCS